MFDKSLNKALQLKQMALHIQIWDGRQVKIWVFSLLFGELGVNKKGKWTGLRSHKQEVAHDEAADEGAWATEEEDRGGAAAPALQAAPGAPSAGEELLAVMRTFLEGQQRREEGFLAELRGLQASMPTLQQGQPVAEQRPVAPSPAPARATSPSEESKMSLRLDLPKPAPRPRRSSPMEGSRDRVSSGAESPRPESRPYGDPKIPQYLAGEDIENYLLHFEHIARTWSWPECEWECRLVPLLTGKALEAYTAMDEERAHSYPDLKTALLTKFDISPETYRQLFRSMALPCGENPSETYHRLKGLYRRWIRPVQHTKEQIGEQIILEQLLRVIPTDIRTSVKEHEPTDGLAAAKLAQQYINARRGGPASYQGGPGRQPSSQPRPAARANPPLPGERHPAPSQHSSSKELICFYCQQAGHKASLCPIRKAKLSGACYTPRTEDGRAVGRRQRVQDITINGEPPDCKEGLTKDIWKVPGDMWALQREDGTLKTLFTKAVGGLDVAKEGKECFVIDNDVLYALADGVKRLVVPGSCRPMIMHLAHTLPWAGHLGRNKTYLRLASRFYWPSMYTDVQTFCRTCSTCQKTCYVRQSDCAYLQPLPIIATTFRRIAMDIVGPLVRSSRGHQYILVVCDYATRFPEAFPLCTVTAPAVLRCLVQLFSRVGVPDEIITDQATNFTSRLQQLFHQQLGIAAIKTTPYHSQTDGEVPQASTGFSPFELLYGWDVQGPLDLLLKTWEAPATSASDRSVVQFVLEMRDRLAKYRDEAEARHREFQPGQKVLLLLPSSNSKLLAKWQGPYTILRKMGPVTYEIHHPVKKKAKQIYHVNLLKEWKEAPVQVPVASLLVTEVGSEGEEESTLADLNQSAEPALDHLSVSQCSQLSQGFG
eukprot:superscaffoldBa00003444_g16958